MLLLLEVLIYSFFSISLRSVRKLLSLGDSGLGVIVATPFCFGVVHALLSL